MLNTASRALPNLVLTSGVGRGGGGYSTDKKETKSQVAETRWPLVIPVLWRQEQGIPGASWMYRLDGIRELWVQLESLPQ